MLKRNIRGLPLRPFAWRLLRAVGITPKMVYSALGRAKITPKQKDLLNLMREDNQRAESPFKSTKLWKNINQIFEDIFYSEGLDNVEEGHLSNFFASHPPLHLAYYRLASYMLYQQLKKRDKYNLLGRVNASLDEFSQRSVRFDDSVVTWDFLISVDTVLSIADADDRILSEPVVVVDLGAGWGRLGYVIKSVNPRASLVICDLPETLLVAHVYLPKVLPGEKVYPYTENRNVEKFSKNLLLERQGITFCGTQDLARFEENSIDYFINVASFQEMSFEQINQYFDLIDEKVKGVFYTWQHWHSRGKIKPAYQDYPFKKEWRESFVRTVSWDNRFFEAAYRV